MLLILFLKDVFIEIFGDCLLGLTEWLTVGETKKIDELDRLISLFEIALCGWPDCRCWILKIFLLLWFLEFQIQSYERLWDKTYFHDPLAINSYLCIKQKILMLFELYCTINFMKLIFLLWNSQKKYFIDSETKKRK